ncbi:hypothetical protein QTP88_007203 [Uroleucon formosanum]
MWDGVKIVHGKPRHSQIQGSIERANQDFQNILRAMMEDNDTIKWSEALPFVQFTENTMYQCIIKVLGKRHTKLSAQTDPENKGSDKNEVEEESNIKSDDNFDDQENNDEDKLNNGLLNVDQGRMDYQNILAVVMEIESDFYKLETKYGIISQLYTRNQFAVCKEKLISLNGVLFDKTMS